VFGGMLAATLLTLLFVPVFYAMIEEWREGREANISEEHAATGDDASHPAAAE